MSNNTTGLSRSTRSLSRRDRRLSTGFNFYSHLWTEALMADLQTYILRIIKARSEKT